MEEIKFHDSFHKFLDKKFVTRPSGADACSSHAPGAILYRTRRILARGLRA